LKSNRGRKDVVAALSQPPPDAPERRDAAGRARKKKRSTTPLSTRFREDAKILLGRLRGFAILH
jgi:hypothetical protein